MTWWWNGCTLTGRNPRRPNRRRTRSRRKSRITRSPSRSTASGRPFPNQRAAEQAAYQEYRDNLRRNAENFRITDDHLGEGGPKAKYQANVAAIKLLKYLEETTGQATPEQQEVLSRYVGWGGLADAFDPDKPAWAAEYSELKELLTPEEYAAARASTLNAHYTSPTVIRAIYEAVEQMGFRTGNILEPSCGVGNFFGMLPESMAGAGCTAWSWTASPGGLPSSSTPRLTSPWRALRPPTGGTFTTLPSATCPFGQYQVNDKAYNKLGFNIHNYFFAKALDQVRPGGVVAFVTSRYTMDAKDSTVRRYLAQRAELLGAIRLPNNAFQRQCRDRCGVRHPLSAKAGPPAGHRAGLDPNRPDRGRLHGQPVFSGPPGDGAGAAHR